MKALIKMSMLCLAIALAATACKEDEGNPDTGESNFLIKAEPEGGGSAIVHAVPQLTSGTYSIANAREVIDEPFQMLANGNLYASWGSGYKEFEYTASGDIAIKRTIGSYRGGLFDVGNGKMVGIRTDFDYSGPYMIYDFVDVATFTVTKVDSIPLSPLSQDLIFYPTGVKGHGEKLIFTYAACYPDTYGSNDTAYAVIVNRNTLKYEKTIKEIRTCSIGIPYFSNQDGFTYNGDLYIQSSNTDWWGLYESKPTGILRIKAGQTDWDPDYFFNVSALTGEANVLLASVGNGKAITQVHKKNLVVEYSDYDQKFVIEHWLLDLNTKTAAKLNIPLSRGTGIKIVKIDDTKYAIGASTTEGSFFYIYDTGTGNVSKGAQYIGGILDIPVPL